MSKLTCTTTYCKAAQSMQLQDCERRCQPFLFSGESVTNLSLKCRRLSLLSKIPCSCASANAVMHVATKPVLVSLPMQWSMLQTALFLCHCRCSVRVACNTALERSGWTTAFSTACWRCSDPGNDHGRQGGSVLWQHAAVHSIQLLVPRIPVSCK